MSNKFFNTAIAVRKSFSTEDCYYKLKRELLKQIVASYLDCGGEEDFTKLQIKYNLMEFSSTPTEIVIDLTNKLLSSLSIDMVFQEAKNNFCYHETLFFSKP